MMNVLLQPTEQTRSRRKAEVVNELLWVAGPKERSPALAPGPLCGFGGMDSLRPAARALRELPISQHIPGR